MCGIAGTLRLDGGPVGCADIRRMTDAIGHRGPDGEGQWCEAPVGLGHRRLAVIDLSSDAAQPMHSIDGRYVITYNGEVYNYRELRRELEKQGSRFISQSDTEVVLEAVARWGIEVAIRRFNGMFAFAIWDRHARRLLLGRDRYGIKPLYVWRDAGQVSVASEPKAFRVLPGFVPKLDAEAMAEYFTFQNILTDRTFLRDVSVFPPGTWGEIHQEDGILRTFQYWHFNFHEPTVAESEEDYAEELRRLLAQAVDRQLVSDVEVGAYLSGGLDSGSIVAMAAQELPGIKTFTVGFDLRSVFEGERQFDERAAAQVISQFVGSTHFEVVIGPEHLRRCLSDLAYHLEEPRVGQSYPNYYAAELASQFVKVVFAGTGGDEVLGGYPWRYPPEGMRLDDFDAWHFAVWQRLLSDEQLRDFLAPLSDDLCEFDAREIHRAVLGSDRKTGAESGDYLSAALNFEANTFLRGLLAVEDRLSMSHGLEVRVPFLDNDLVDFCQGLPRCTRLRASSGLAVGDEGAGGTSSGKRILRGALRGLLPDPTLGASKQGFSGPDSQWFANDLRAYIVELLETFDPDVADSTVMLHVLNDSGGSSASSRLLPWSIAASSLHLRDYWPDASVIVDREKA